MQRDIERVLIDRAAIAQRVRQLAQEITSHLSCAHPASVCVPSETDFASITLVPILTGSLIFVADLIRQMPMRMQIQLISISSYPGRSTTSQTPKIDSLASNLPDSFADTNVLIIDDILDSGRTLQLASEVIRRKNPRTLRTCVMLRKQRPQAMGFPVDYFGFDIPDQFVVGYGLDYNDYYRNLPDIVTLRPEVIAARTGP